MFGPFPGGPDWIDERQRADEYLHIWREDVKAAGRDYKKRSNEWNKKYLPEHSKNTPNTLDEYFE